VKRLDWMFALRDGFSSTARKMTSGLNSMRTGFRRSGQAGQQMGSVVARGAGLPQRPLLRLISLLQRTSTASSAFDHIRNKAAGAANGLRGLVANLTSLPGLLAAGAVGLTGKSIFDAIGFKESQLVSFDVLLRPQVGMAEAKKAAAGLYSTLTEYADVSPFDTQEVLTSGKALLAAGVRLKNIRSVLSDAGDLSAGIGAPLTEVAQAFSRLRGGDFGDAFERFRDWGINRQVLEGKGLKFDGSGQYLGSVNMAMAAVREVIRDRTKGAADALGKTLFGLMSTLRSRSFNLFSSIDADENGPLKPVKALLNNLITLTDFKKGPGAAIQAQFKSGLSGLLKAAFGPLADATEPKKAGQAILTFLNQGTQLVNRAREIFPVALGYARQFWTGFQSGMATLQSAWDFIRPGVTILSKLTQSTNGVQMVMGRTNSSALVLVGTVAALFAGWSLLNLVTFGGAGALLRWGVAATGAVIPAIYRMIAGSGLLTVAKARLAAQSVAMGLRMAAAWLIGMGPIGWVIAGVSGVVAAIVVAYNRFGWFRDGVNNAWASIKAGGASFLGWIQTLPSLILSALKNLPGQMAQAGMNAVAGLWDGLKSKLGGVKAAGANLGNAAASGTQSALQVRSPSRRTKYFGRMTGVGLEQGLDAMRSRVRRAGSALGVAALPSDANSPSIRTPTLPAAVTAARGGTAPNITITFGDIVVPQVKSAAEAKEFVVSAFYEALERSNMELGDDGA
jgi:hypothetical protein